MRRALCIFLSACMAGLGVPPAMSQGTSTGSGGSITIDTVDPVTGKHVDAGLIRQGQQVRVIVKAFDSFGRAVECNNPSIGVINGVAGTQLIAPAPGAAPDIITGGPNFGSAEITATCPKLPNVQAKSFAASTGRPLGGARPQPAPQPAPAPQPTPAPAAAGSGSGIGTVLLIGGVAIAAGAAAAAAGSGGGSSSSAASCSSGQFCRTAQGKTGCCQSGGFVQLCQNSNVCANIEPFTGGQCPGGEEKHLNCCGGPADCGINR